jgi:homoserine O-succinyltransferase
MPTVIEGGRVPACWVEHNSARAEAQGCDKEAECVRVAFINNMPDSALEDTEMQFFDLLDAASGDIPVRVQLYSLPGVPRGGRGQQHLERFYASTDHLWDSHFDSVIMTGTEPRQPNLKDEPYWPSLTKVLDWAEENTVSTVLSCLAAHAAVLYSDGIARHPLPDKQFGVFEYKTVCDHALTSGASSLVQFPHSRWNEVQEEALTSCGYVVLTKSEQAGVDSFVKKKKKSLFVHLQGHPEYRVETLLKEYKRDIKRFLRAERETYPSMPQGYFDVGATDVLADFRQNAIHCRQDDRMADFPGQLVARLQNTWRTSATCLYHNWLQYVLSRKAESPELPPLVQSGDQRDEQQRKGLSSVI